MIKKHKNYLIYWLALSNNWTNSIEKIKKRGSALVTERQIRKTCLAPTAGKLGNTT